MYNLNGIAEYRYDSNSRVVEVVNLDPQTLNEFLPDGSDYICKYFYDESGAINKLIYFGKEFRIESISEENVATAICDSEANVITARLTFNDNGILVLEEFYEKDTLVLKNKFDSNGLPSGFDYAGLGKMSFNYEDKETYISVTP